MKKQLVEGEDFYFNRDGFIVLTDKYHLDLGYCCGYGCTHCPYEFENVHEPRRSELIKEKNSDGQANTK
jgi:hypothetical protein